jgi:NtrC-family two-component system response regulator AlgB
MTPRPAVLKPRVLVVDDERNIRTTLVVCLEDARCDAVAVGGGAAALAEIQRERFDIAFVDLRLGRENGLELLGRLLGANVGLAVVMITAFADFDTAVEAIKRGAWDFLPKPFTPAQIRHVVDKYVQHQDLLRRAAEAQGLLASVVPAIDIESRSPRMRAVVDTAMRVAVSNASVLLRGENGTGKGVLARAMHAHSARAARPFVVVHSPTLSEELLTSELFGHVRGAFTGATRDQPGRVETAQGGTLFLDEIAEVSPALQAKLLRFVQDHEFERIGETQTRRADVRIMAATNRDLEEAVASGRFREDLFYRLNVVELALPPLRERREDILPMAERFLAFFGRAAGRAGLSWAPAALEALAAYSWPGNVRELRNVVERAVILWPGDVVEVDALPEKIAQTQGEVAVLGGDFALEAIQREHIQRVMARCPTLDEAAHILGIDTSTLYRRRKRYEQA